MGVARSLAGWLIREHERRPFAGPVLIFGRQNVFVTLDEFESMMRARGLRPRPLPRGMPAVADIPSWTEGIQKGFTNDSALFWMLAGLKVEHLDCSSYEGAEHIHDLNHPVPKELCGRYQLVLDCGTMEHVFDVRSTLRNIDLLAAPGGRVLHVSQASNWIEHGYYQFSPTLFFDFYGVNHYDDMICWLADQGSADLNRTPWDWYKWPSDGRAPAFLSPNPVGIFFTAVRGEGEPLARVPRQGEYRGREAFGASAPPWWRAAIPRSVSRFARKAYWRLKREGRF